MPNTTEKLFATKPVLQQYALPLALAVLVVFHAVGFWGLTLSGSPAYFQQLTPMNLLLTALLMFSFHKQWNRGFALFAVLIPFVGFVAEVVGVHTGLLFGNYSYGAALGPKVWQVPLLIGLNWLLLVYATGCIMHLTKLPTGFKAVGGALLMLLLDYFIEPVAMKFDFWQWHSKQVPLSNYTGWFMLALLLQGLFQWVHMYKSNRLAPFVYLVQLLFFFSLFVLLQT